MCLIIALRTNGITKSKASEYETYLDNINKLISSAFNRIYICETDGKVMGVLVIQLAG